MAVASTPSMTRIKTNTLIHRKALRTLRARITLPKEVDVSAAVEIIRFKVDADAVDRFKQGRRAADEALQRFDGFLGSELLAGADGTWVLLVRWASRAAVDAAQAVTLASPGVPEVQAWVAIAREVQSFETVEQAVQFVPASAAAPLDVALRFVRDGLGRADLAAFDDCIDPDVTVVTALSPQGPIHGREAYKAIFAEFARCWPVREMVIHDSFAAGDRVVVSFTATAVFEHDYYGVAATGAIVPLVETHVYTVRDGRITANRVGAINLPFEFIMYPVLKDAVLGGLEYGR